MIEKQYKSPEVFLGDNNEKIVSVVRQELISPVIHRVDLPNLTPEEEYIVRYAQLIYRNHVMEARRLIFDNFDYATRRYQYSKSDAVDKWNDLVNACLSDDFRERTNDRWDAYCTAREWVKKQKDKIHAAKAEGKLAKYILHELRNREKATDKTLMSGIRALVPRTTPFELHYAMIGREVADDLLYTASDVYSSFDKYGLSPDDISKMASETPDEDPIISIGAFVVGAQTQTGGDVGEVRKSLRDATLMEQRDADLEERVPAKDFPYKNPLFLDKGELPEGVTTEQELLEHYIAEMDAIVREFHL